MKLEQLNLKPGQWLLANCGKFPSEMNCKMVFMAPENQREELLTTLVEHAVNQHKHEKTSELKQDLDQFLEVVNIQ